MTNSAHQSVEAPKWNDKQIDYTDPNGTLLLMATLEFISYIPHRPLASESGQVTWEVDRACSPIDHLPQLFWRDGTPWSEANLWAHQRATSGGTDLKTVQCNLRHLHKFAEWLEAEQLDWRHFPMLERDRVLIRWRKHLVELRDRHGLLAPSTATQRMNAAVSFYRYAKAYGFIGRDAPMWTERQVVHRFHDTHGFERTMLLASTDLAIPNRRRHGLQLEDGLLPITRDEMYELRSFTEQACNTSREVHLMLSLGFYSGARIETISALRRGTLENALRDPAAPSVVYLAVGPGHRPFVPTKFNVQGRIMAPAWLIDEIVDYIGDARRLRREARAAPKDRDLVFLTRFGRSYADRESNSGTAIDRAMVDLRRKAEKFGLAFAKNIHFHVSRATFGTWLTSTLLEQGHNPKAVLSFVSDAMLHKSVETTLKYIKFVEQTPIKIAVADEFTQAFLGVRTRLGTANA